MLLLPGKCGAEHPGKDVRQSRLKVVGLGGGHTPHLLGLGRGLWGGLNKFVIKKALLILGGPLSSLVAVKRGLFWSQKPLPPEPFLDLTSSGFKGHLKLLGLRHPVCPISYNATRLVFNQVPQAA